MKFRLKSSLLMLISAVTLAVPFANAQQTNGNGSPASTLLYPCTVATQAVLGVLPIVWGPGLQASPNCLNGIKPGQLSGSVWSANINSDGTVISGSNWIKVNRSSAGVYVITFIDANGSPASFPGPSVCVGNASYLAPGTTDPATGKPAAVAPLVGTVDTPSQTTVYVSADNPQAVREPYDSPFSLICTTPQ